jgi:hypothetical protein
VSGTKILILGAVFRHVVGGSEHGGGDGQDGFLGATTCTQALELSLQIRVFDAYCGPPTSFPTPPIVSDTMV